MARIVIAEDNEYLQEVCRLDLEEQGHDVKVVGDGYDLLSYFKEDSADLLILDIMLPHKSGAEVIGTVRALCPGLAIVIYTGYDRYKDSPIHDIADAFVLKSSSIEKLLKTVNGLLSDRKQVPDVEDGEDA